MNEKVQTLADLIRADPSEITGGLGGVYYYNKKAYWVVETEKRNVKHDGWRWIGQLGDMHVYRQDRLS